MGKWKAEGFKIMDKLILAALLKEWLEDLTNAIDGLEAFPPLKDRRKVVRLEDEPNWGISGM